MFKPVVISFIFHIAVFLVVSLATFFQPNYHKLEKPKITRVKFYKRPEPQKPEPEPRQIIAEPEPEKKQKKPEPVKKTPKPAKKKKKKPVAEPAPTPYRKPKPTPRPTPRPRPTVWPPLPEKTSAPEKTPARTPSSSSSDEKAPLDISHEQLPSYYLSYARSKIESNFRLTRSRRYEGMLCRVQFRVNREGKIYDIRVVRSTGKPELDRFAVEAVEETGKLGPLPDSIRDSSIIITANFDFSPGTAANRD